MIERLRDWWPVPHDVVQLDQEEKPDTWQCTGQSPWLQLSTSSTAPQVVLPPQLAGVWVRVRVLVPAPQEWVQVSKLP